MPTIKLTSADLSRLRLPGAKEDVVIKLVFPLHRRPDFTREEFQTYWREKHAPLVIEPAATLGYQAIRSSAHQ